MCLDVGLAEVLPEAGDDRLERERWLGRERLGQYEVDCEGVSFRNRESDGRGWRLTGKVNTLLVEVVLEYDEA